MRKFLIGPRLLCLTRALLLQTDSTEFLVLQALVHSHRSTASHANISPYLLDTFLVLRAVILNQGVP